MSLILRALTAIRPNGDRRRVQPRSRIDFLCQRLRDDESGYMAEIHQERWTKTGPTDTRPRFLTR
jgi:hypothetical protein